MHKISCDRSDVRLYQEDFVAEIRRLDDLVFVQHGHPPATIVSFPEYPEGGMPGIRVGMIASLLKKVPAGGVDAANVITFPKNHECYALWQSGIARKLRSPQFSGYGDVQIRQFWFLSAIALVRSRVILRRKWFPAATLRTVKSMRRKHSSIFGEDAFMEMRKLADMFDGRELSDVEMDMQLTMFYAAAAIQNKVVTTNQSLYELLISD